MTLKVAEGVTVTLTKEQILDIQRQQEEIARSKKTIKEKVRTLEDAYKEVGMIYTPMYQGSGVSPRTKLFYPKHDGAINKTEDNSQVKCAFSVASEVRAKSLLAYAQLSVIADALNEGNNQTHYMSTNAVRYRVMYEKGTGLISRASAPVAITEAISFHSRELADYSIQRFNGLWLDYFMIPKLALRKESDYNEW